MPICNVCRRYYPTSTYAYTIGISHQDRSITDLDFFPEIPTSFKRNVTSGKRFLLTQSFLRLVVLLFFCYLVISLFVTTLYLVHDLYTLFYPGRMLLLLLLLRSCYLLSYCYCSNRLRLLLMSCLFLVTLFLLRPYKYVIAIFVSLYHVL